MIFVHLVIGVALLEFLYFGFAVGRAREKYGVKAPATTGNEMFERYYRVQMNTLEQLIVFIPGIVLFAHYIEPQCRRTLALSSFAIRLHLLQLPLHDSPLMMGVERGNKNSYKADTSGSPKTNNPRFLPPILLCIFGASLVICTVKFLLYAMDSANKLFYVAFLGGFPFFCVGIALILFCFLYDPPTIFGFSIGSWHLVPL